MTSQEKTARHVGAADEAIGLRLRKARYKTDQSQKDIAQKLGISSQQYYKYEQGINRIPVARLIEIARILDIDPSEILGTSGDGDTPLSLGGAGDLDQRAYDLWNKLGGAQSKRLVLELMRIIGRDQ